MTRSAKKAPLRPGPSLNPPGKPGHFLIGVRKKAARFRSEDGKTLLEWPTGDLTTRILAAENSFTAYMAHALRLEKYDEAEAILCLRVHFWRVKGSPVVEVLAEEEWSYCPVRKEMYKRPEANAFVSQDQEAGSEN